MNERAHELRAIISYIRSRAATSDGFLK